MFCFRNVRRRNVRFGKVAQNFYRSVSQRAMAKVLKIGTHNGTFHTDEALACYMLKRLPEYENAEIIRSRDSKELDPCDILVDVGGVYDPLTKRYDHHQKTFETTMQALRPKLNSGIRLSSAGLIYHHFGERILEAIMGKALDQVEREKMFSYVYFHFVQEIDAVDNGIPMYDTGEKRYGFNTDLSSRLARLNPDWHAQDQTTTVAMFEKAMAYAGNEFEECVFRFRDDVWPARTIVQSAVDQRFQVHPSGEIIEIKFCPWKSHLFEIEKEQGIEGTIKYAIFGDAAGSWRANAVPLSPGNYLLRIPLHAAWCGLREEELQKASAVPDAIFVHSSGFIGGARSREGALALASRTQELQNVQNEK